MTESDRVREVVLVRHASVFLESTKATQKEEQQMAKFHLEKGAQLLMDNTRCQLQNAQANFEEAKKGPHEEDLEKLQELRTIFDRLTLTLQKLVGFTIVDSDLDDGLFCSLGAT